MGKGSGDGGMYTLGGDPTQGPAAAKPSFVDHLGDYLKQRFPIATGMAGAAGVNLPGSPPTDNSAPGVNLPQQQLPDYSGLIQQNAQPKSSGIGKLLLSLLGG